MHCPICNSFATDVGNTLTHLLPDQQVYYCDNCTHTFVAPSTFFDIDAYNASFYVNSYNKRGLLSILLDYIQSLSRLEYINSFAPSSSSIRLLEVGPGYNPIARVNKSRFCFSYVETDKSAFSYLSSLSNQSFQTLDQVPDQNFDLVVFNHVLEHIIDVKAFINKCLDKLVPGGLLCLEVPNRDYYRSQVNTCLPHYHSFSKDSLYYLFNHFSDRTLILSLDEFSYKSSQSIAGYQICNRIFNLIRCRFKDRMLISLLDSFGLIFPPFHITQSAPTLWLRTILKKRA